MSVPLLAHSALLRSDLREFAPAAGTRTVAVCTWEGSTGARDTVNVLPDGCADLMWDGTGLRVSGVQTGTVTERATGSHTVGIRLHPGALGPLLGLPAPELPAGAVDLCDVWGRSARSWSRRLAAAPDSARAREMLESLVVTRLAAGAVPDPRVTVAARALAEPRTSVDDAARRAGVSGRELRRRFGQDVGVGPKQLQRILRFRRFVRSLDTVARRRTTLACAAVELGYADQAHLGRECRELANRSPAALAATWAAHVGPGSDDDPGPVARP